MWTWSIVRFALTLALAFWATGQCDAGFLSVFHAETGAGAQMHLPFNTDGEQSISGFQDGPVATQSRAAVAGETEAGDKASATSRAVARAGRGLVGTLTDASVAASVSSPEAVNAAGAGASAKAKSHSPPADNRARW